MSTPHLTRFLPFPKSRGRTLLRGLTACYFLRAGHHSDTELACFDVLIGLVLVKVEPLARTELAERLADQIRPPRRVLMRLASDEIEVAAPILVRSPALTDADLETLALHQPPSHLAVIAARRGLVERVTDVLVARGDGIVIDRVIRNHMATVSVQSFVRLSERTDANEAILGLLMSRPDLPEQIAVKLAPQIRDALHGALDLLVADVDVPTRAELVKQSRTVLAERLRPTMATARPRNVLLDLMSRGLLALGDAINELADADKALDVASLIGARLALGPETVMIVLFAPSEEPMTVLCRAAGLNLNGFSSVLRMRRRRRACARSPAEVLSAFSRMQIDSARRGVDLFKSRTARKGDGARASTRV